MKRRVFVLLVLLTNVAIKGQSPWVATNTPTVGSFGRYDDVCFLNADTGWTVNSNGKNS